MAKNQTYAIFSCEDKIFIDPKTKETVKYLSCVLAVCGEELRVQISKQDKGLFDLLRRDASDDTGCDVELICEDCSFIDARTKNVVNYVKCIMIYRGEEIRLKVKSEDKSLLEYLRREMEVI